MLRSSARIERQLLQISRRGFSDRNSKLNENDQGPTGRTTIQQNTKDQSNSNEKDEYEDYERINEKNYQFERMQRLLRSLSLIPLTFMALLYIFGDYIEIKIDRSENPPANPEPENQKPFNRDEIVTVVKKVDVGPIQVPISIPMKKVIKFQDVIVSSSGY